MMRKKARQTSPNYLLRRARLERGWTQKVVAERIGAPNDVTVTRWERGTTFLSPHYVERLCQLFEQPASALGLLKEAHTPVASQSLSVSPSRSGASEHAALLLPRQTGSLFSTLPLVGREADLHALQVLYRSVQQGQVRIVLIKGEAGIGKTRLAATFLSWAASEGATILAGRAFEMGDRLPYQSLVHALSRSLEKEQALEARLGATWLSELSRILPELRERYPFLPEVPGDEMTARIRLFEAVTRLVQALCEQRAVVLFVDDVQWADAASLDVLRYAGQRWSESETPVLLLLSLRSEALTPASLLSRWIASLHRELPVTDLTPGPLTLEETLHLLGSLAYQPDISLSQTARFNQFGQWLFRETGGQPFYLVETLKDLLERKILVLRSPPQGKELELDMAALSALQQQSMLPPGVRRLILSQVERLTPAGRSLLVASAILGQEASFDLLSRVAGVGEREALAALEELLRQGLLREESAESGRGPHYLFGHDKIRETITTEMSEAELHLLHCRALALLEAEDRPAAELAHHARASGLSEQVVRFSLAAGDEAVRCFANTEARQHYSQALKALSQLPETTATQETRVETLLKLVQVSWMAVDVEHTLRRLTGAEHLAYLLHDQKQVALIHYWIAVVHGTRNTMRQARSYAEQVLREAQALGDEELVALAALQLGRVLINQGQFSSIEELLTPAIPLLERAGNWLAWTDALGYLGYALAARGQYAAGVTQGQRAVERARQAGEIENHYGLHARHFLSIILMSGDDCSQALEANEQVVREAERIGDWLLVYWACAFRAWAEGRLGKHEEALQSLAHARTAGNRLGEHIMGQDLLEGVTAAVLLAAGRVDEALAHARATVELAREEVGSFLSEGIAERVLGQALAHRSRWEEARAHLAASVQAFLAGEALLEAARTQMVWGLLCRDHGEEAEALAHFEQALARFKSAGLTRACQTAQEYLAHKYA
ncbi:MAG: AAA family ATPase [Ktedonobacteraceae bacterium]|nr:AAA family ATPase [Ktedonobacteraceae bacterium]